MIKEIDITLKKVFLLIVFIISSLNCISAQQISYSIGVDLFNLPEYGDDYIPPGPSTSFTYSHRLSETIMLEVSYRHISTPGNRPIIGSGRPHLHFYSDDDNYVFKNEDFKRGFGSINRNGSRYKINAYFIGVGAAKRLFKYKRFKYFLDLNCSFKKRIQVGLLRVSEMSELITTSGETININAEFFQVFNRRSIALIPSQRLSYDLTENFSIGIINGLPYDFDEGFFFLDIIFSYRI